MRFVQKVSRLQETVFEFEEKQLKYAYEGEKQKIAFSVSYAALGTNKSMQTLHSTVVTSSGAALFLSVFFSLPTLIFSDITPEQEQIAHGGLLHFILFVMVVALLGAGVALFGYIGKNHDATVISAGLGLGNIIIFRDNQHQLILDEILKRRISELRRINGTVDTLNHPELELQKFLALKEHKIISDEEFSEARTKITVGANIL